MNLSAANIGATPGPGSPGEYSGTGSSGASTPSRPGAVSMSHPILSECCRTIDS